MPFKNTSIAKCWHTKIRLSSSIDTIYEGSNHTEPLGGAHKDYDKAALLVKEAVVRSLDSLKDISPETLKEQRYERFRTIAYYAEEKAENTAGDGETGEE